MLRALTSVALIALTLTFSACDVPSKEAQDKLSAAEQRVARLEKTAAQLDTRLVALDVRTTNLESSEQVHDLVQSLKDSAYLTPGSEGYQGIEFSVGTLAVSLEDIRPYANGSRVVLDFGNPSSAMVTGISMDIEWGKSAADTSTTKSRQFTFTENLRGGAWTKIPVVLEGVPPTDLGFVRVKNFKNAGISLMMTALPR